jgi:heme-degrading monooxygenase HmoA
MHARVVFTHVQADMEDAVIQLYDRSVLPAAMQQPGFRGLLHLVDHSKGKGISITLWETEDDMLAGESNGYYQEQLAKFEDKLSAFPTREDYEVTAKVL